MGFVSDREQDAVALSPEPCEHADLWRARDGEWRCMRCEPPAFPGEVLEQRALDWVMTLFAA